VRCISCPSLAARHHTSAGLVSMLRGGPARSKNACGWRPQAVATRHGTPMQTWAAETSAAHRVLSEPCISCPRRLRATTPPLLRGWPARGRGACWLATSGRSHEAWEPPCTHLGSCSMLARSPHSCCCCSPHHTSPAAARWSLLYAARATPRCHPAPAQAPSLHYQHVPLPLSITKCCYCLQDCCRRTPGGTSVDGTT
jgi:hypothetical protein